MQRGSWSMRPRPLARRLAFLRLFGAGSGAEPNGGPQLATRSGARFGAPVLTGPRPPCHDSTVLPARPWAPDPCCSEAHALPYCEGRKRTLACHCARSFDRSISAQTFMLTVSCVGRGSGETPMQARSGSSSAEGARNRSVHPGPNHHAGSVRTKPGPIILERRRGRALAEGDLHERVSAKTPSARACTSSPLVL
jgi:hypothetical protein